MSVVRPIAFDQKRKGARRERARLAQQKRRAQQFDPGGEWYYPAAIKRMVREPWDITFKADEGNDNWPVPKRRPRLVPSQNKTEKS